MVPESKTCIQYVDCQINMRVLPSFSFQPLRAHSFKELSVLDKSWRMLVNCPNSVHGIAMEVTSRDLQIRDSTLKPHPMDRIASES